MAARKKKPAPAHKPLWLSVTVWGATIYAAAAELAPVVAPHSVPLLLAAGKALGIVLAASGARRAVRQLLPSQQ